MLYTDRLLILIYEWLIKITYKQIQMKIIVITVSFVYKNIMVLFLDKENGGIYEK